MNRNDLWYGLGKGLPWACKEPSYTLGSVRFVDSGQSVTFSSTKLLPEDEADAWKHVRVLRLYKMLLHIYCAFVGLDNRWYFHQNTSKYFLADFSKPCHCH
jgi:hypothetical protein